jgi:protein TonB
MARKPTNQRTRGLPRRMTPELAEAMVPALAARRGTFAWLPWIAGSALLHAALALPLMLSGAVQPLVPERPRALRVQLLREAPGPAETPAPAPKPAVAAAPPPKPAPVRKPVAQIAAAKPPPVAADIAVAPAPVVGDAAPAQSAAPAGAVAVAAAVSSGPPGGGSASGDLLAAYVKRVRDAIARHKRYPSLARRRGIEGRVTLQLAIASDGSVTSSEAVGSPPVLLAKSALAAVASASPFDPPPAGSLRIEVPIRFALNE